MAKKKLYPRNSLLRVAVIEQERQAILRAAERENMTASDWIYRCLQQCGLEDELALYFPEDAPKIAQQRTENGAS